MIKYYKGNYKSVYTSEVESETDYIAREVARDLMYHNQGPLTEYDLDDLPPADVRPVVRGKWERLTWGFEYDRCSVCGYEHRWPGPFYYCPKCGAYNV